MLAYCLDEICDRLRLNTVLLANGDPVNAVRHARSSVRLGASGYGDSCVVSVTDDGPGMSPELRARAFERFSRGETAGAIPGSGLGLAIGEWCER